MTDGLSDDDEGEIGSSSDFWAKFAAVVDEADHGVVADHDADPWTDVDLDPSGLTPAQRQVLKDQPEHPRLSRGFSGPARSDSGTGNPPGDAD